MFASYSNPNRRLNCRGSNAMENRGVGGRRGKRAVFLSDNSRWSPPSTGVQNPTKGERILNLNSKRNKAHSLGLGCLYV